MQDLDRVRSAFVDPEEFWSSPLYRRLSAVVAADPFLVRIAACARPGQHPTFPFFGAIHELLLGGVAHPLGDYYPSLRGDRALAVDGAGPALQAFARRYTKEIEQIIRTRLVQTNHVQRAFGLRLGLAAIAGVVGNRPVHLLEVGSSAGLVLRQSLYGYLLGGRAAGVTGAPIQLAAEWRSNDPVPDLDAVPAIASVTGIDLNPLDPSSAADRLWLQALVWPEDRAKAELLEAALALAAREPVTVLAGDAIDLCPQWSSLRPAGEPRVVFHCATRMHVPVHRRLLFDDAIARIGEDGPLFHIAVEGDGITITDPAGVRTRHYDVDGHLAWAKPA